MLSEQPMVLAEKLLVLLDEAALTSTYKPALLLALIDRSQEVAGRSEPLTEVPVRDLARRVAELYWPQTVAYPQTGHVLWQNQGARQAKIVQRLVRYRREAGAGERVTLAGFDEGRSWDRVLDDIELSLAEMPIPRLQEPYSPFLYGFDWRWDKAGGWSARAYRASSRAVRLFAGVGDALIALAPLLRPFITRWWTDKAAALNQHAIPDADALVGFEQFLFGRERVSLRRLVNDLVDLQAGDCFYCRRRLTRVEVDHFLPWSHSADDGLDNLVAACPACNNAKRAILPAADHVADWLDRGRRWNADLSSIATTKQWPRDVARTRSVSRALYLRSPDERPTWRSATAGQSSALLPLEGQRRRLTELLN